MLVIDAAFMLKKLAGGVRPGEGARRPPVPRGFDVLVGRARSGDVRTDRPVTVGVGVQSQLGAELRRWLGVVADVAESSAVEVAAVIVGGRMYRLSVTDRRVDAEADLSGGGVVEGVGMIAALPMPRDHPGSPASDLDPESTGAAGGALIEFAASQALSGQVQHLFGHPPGESAQPGTSHARGTSGAGGRGLTNASLVAMLASAVGR